MPPNQRRAKQRCRGCGLDTHAALPNAPEKAGVSRIESELHTAIRGKGSKARPLALDRFDRPVDRLFESIDGNCDVQLFSCRIARIDRRLVQRADPDAIVALTLEIEAVVEVGDEWQAPKILPPDSELDH